MMTRQKIPDETLRKTLKSFNIKESDAALLLIWGEMYLDTG